MISCDLGVWWGAQGDTWGLIYCALQCLELALMGGFPGPGSPQPQKEGMGA